MHCANNAVIMQTSQLGQIEALEENVCILKGKLAEQDRVIANLVGDNLNHLQDNMRLTAFINSSQTRMAGLEQKLIELGELFLVAMGQSSSEQGMLDAGGDDEDDQDGGEGSGGAGASPSGSMRLETTAPRERGLVEQMEEEGRLVLGGGSMGWTRGYQRVGVGPTLMCH